MSELNNLFSNFDFGFKIDWTNEHHKKVNHYLNALTIYIGTRFNGCIHNDGSYLLYRFTNDRSTIEKQINIFRVLFKNESPSTFKEEIINGCHIFIF